MWLSSQGICTQYPLVPPRFTQLPDLEPGASFIEEQPWALRSLSQQSSENRKLSPSPSLQREVQEGSAQWVPTVLSAFAGKPAPLHHQEPPPHGAPPLLSDDCPREGMIE